MKIYTHDYFIEVIVENKAEVVQEVIQDKKEAYEVFKIPKKQGVREIHGLQKNIVGCRLTLLQKNLYKNFLKKIPIAIPAKGFVEGEDYQSFLQPHIGNKFFMRIDIIDFFASFSEAFIRKGLEEYVNDTTSLNEIFELCTIDGKIPQGAITSPALSNILFKRIDQRIMKYCQIIEERNMQQYKRGDDGNYSYAKHIYYTRYADDMLFSSDFLDFEDGKYFQCMIANILKSCGFCINKRKTIIGRNQIAMNGYVVDKCIHLSRNKLKDIKKILYYFRDDATSTYRLDKCKLQDKNEILKGINQLSWKNRLPGKRFANIQQLTYYLSGCRAWILAVLQSGLDTSKKKRNMQKTVQRVQELLDELQKFGG